MDLKRRVALKFLDVREHADADTLHRFHAEARITASLSHPHVVRLLDFDVEDGAPWIAYELMPGGTLADLIRDVRQPWELACRQLAQVLSGLEEAHAHGMLHRDIKAQNVLVAEDGTLKLADFGLAKLVRSEGGDLTRPGVVIGSPGYVAPELTCGVPASVASDVYSAGVLLYEALTGHWPFQAVTLTELLGKHRSAPVPFAQDERPEIPAAVGAVAALAMAKDPAQRWSTARAMREALEEAAGAGPASLEATAALPAAPLGAPKIVSKPVDTSKLRVALAIGLPLGLALLTLALSTRRPPPPAPPSAPPAPARTATLSAALRERALATCARAHRMRSDHETVPSVFLKGVDVGPGEGNAARPHQLRAAITEFRAVHQAVRDLMPPVIREMDEALADRGAAAPLDLALLARLRALDAVATLQSAEAGVILERIDRGAVTDGLVAMVADPANCYPMETIQRVHAFCDVAAAGLARAAAAPAAHAQAIAEVLDEIQGTASYFRFAPLCGLTLPASRERAAARLRAHAAFPATPDGQRLRGLTLDIWDASADAGTPAARRRFPAIVAALHAFGDVTPAAFAALDRLEAHLRDNLGSNVQQGK